MVLVHGLTVQPEFHIRCEYMNSKINLYRKRTFYIMITVLVLIISTVSYTLATLADANEQVKQNITNFSRGSYDILLRPPDARTDLEQKLGIIEENYLGSGEGGITTTQWEDVKEHPQVEIAAPVASVGLFTALKRTWMIKKENDLRYYGVDYSTSDGVNDYTYGKETYMYDFSSDMKSIHQYPSSLEVLNNFFMEEIASFSFPISYHQVVAVDPVEESRLTDYNLSLLNEGIDDGLTLNYITKQELAIPIISLKDVPVPNTIKLTVDSLEEPTEEEVKTWSSKFVDSNPIKTMDLNPIQYEKVIQNYISKKRRHNEEVYVFRPEDGPSPFEILPFYVDEKGKLSPDDGTGEDYLGGSRTPFSQQIGYKLSPVRYDIKNEKELSVTQTGINDDYHAPTYREIEEVEYFKLNENDDPVNEQEAFEFANVGFFSIKENTDKLASAPLGIYGSTSPYLASDPSKKLHPSAVPGSFITTPAHGLISLNWAEKIKGEAPIDAIRVKVAGLTGYDEEAAALIRKLANEWEKGGFTVDIVAGASLQELSVDVEGIGEVMQSFTTLGAADTVVSSWNLLQVVITVLYVLVAFIFIGFTLFHLLEDRQRDEQLLARLGWSHKLIRRLRYKELGQILVIPMLLVFIGFTVYGIIQEEWLPLILAVGVSLLTLLVYAFTTSIQKRKPKKVKQSGGTVTQQNIWFYRFRLLASGLQLLIVTILTCFLPFFLLQSVEQTTQTRLGNYVHGEVEGLFILIIILLYGLSLTTVYQSLKRLWEKRENEIQLFLYLGWGAGAIRKYYLKEVLFWAGIAILAGWIGSICISLYFLDVSTVSVLIGVLGAIFILALTLAGSLYILRCLEKKGGRNFAH